MRGSRKSTSPGKSGRIRPAWSFVLMMLISIGGCAVSQYSKDAPSSAPSELFQIHGKLTYSGNPEYLPRSVHASSTGEGADIKYEYFVHYGTDGESNLTVFNPFLIVGANKATDSVTVVGVLTITARNGKQKIFKDGITVSKNTALFSEGATYTEMRKAGLIRVRNLIDKKLENEKSVLTTFLDEFGEEVKQQHGRKVSEK